MSNERPTFGDDDGTADVATVSQAMPLVHAREGLRVVVVDGPDTGKAFVLEPDASPALVGTSPVCELRLVDPTASRRHAALQSDGARWRVSDLGSTNGTWVDSVSVGTAWVQPGQFLRCGSTVLRIEADRTTFASTLSNAARFGLVIGASHAMRRLYPLAERVARTRVPVIIEGETGTGKEVLAESLHEVGGSRGPFVVFDCTTVSTQLVESELFGHERGAFTGAVATRPGVFEEANGGTLLIDEIGDLELPLQAKLLRVLDRGEVRRVGGRSVIKVDVRILSATRRDLDKAVSEGRFRDDLFHRLAVARLELPPLRERSGDVPLLVRHFARDLTGSADAIPPHVVARFEASPWPGNVRELRNAVARFVALGEDEPGAAAAPADDRETAGSAGPSVLVEEDFDLPFAVARRRAQARFERAYVERLLAKHGGSVTQAARASGIAARYFRLVKARNFSR
ncbi:MAG: Response regulator of zinc sigma-54-dependent two-component system [Labilithrix sp.]|jgi:DNA-binding NtrC family response regulator|nr:Response regulator of zinc sigma-54-dependent two-component system [Labilithrix sp.]